MRYSFSTRDVALTVPSQSQGEAKRVSEHEWASLDAVYRAFISHHNGYLHRGEDWWRAAVLRNFYDRRGSLLDAVVWMGEDDQRRGYVIYEVARPAGRPGSACASATSWRWTADAYVGLVRYLLHHDIASPLQWWVPLGRPVPEPVGRPRAGGGGLRARDVLCEWWTCRAPSLPVPAWPMPPRA